MEKRRKTDKGELYTFAGKARAQPENGFLDKLNLASFEPLEKITDRQTCPKCKSQRKYYCYDCMIGLVDMPNMQLPVKVTVIRHPKEKRSKSSIIPASVLAPKDVEIVHTIDVPEHLSETNTVLMFPSDEATEITDMTKEELAKIERVVLIDSTWSQTKYYLRQPILQKMRHVKI